jgi:predicted RNase H-like nuclease (RuvC/YqgF family)
LARHLTDRDVERVVEILDGWRDKLTWELLCEACAPIIGTKPARQTLAKFVRIENAFEACKKRLKDDTQEMRLPHSIKIAAERITRLERENERLKRENRELLQQFVIWQYNAHIRGLSDRDLNLPLPGIDRGQTD